MKDRVSNGRMCCKEPLMLRSGRLQSRQVAGRARGAGLPAPGLAEGRAHRGANRVGACCGEGQGAEQAHLAGEEGRSSRSPMDQKTYNNRSGSRSGGSERAHPAKKRRPLGGVGHCQPGGFPDDARVAQMVVRVRSHPERVGNRLGSAGSRFSQRNSTRILGTLPLMHEAQHSAAT